MHSILMWTVEDWIKYQTWNASFGHLSETQNPIKTQRPAGKTKNNQMWKTWIKEEVRLISQWRANEGKLCALVSSELTGNKSTSISVIVSPVISMQNTKHKNTQIIAALAFSTTWTDKLQNKKQKKQESEGQANLASAPNSVGDMTRDRGRETEEERGRAC